MDNPRVETVKCGELMAISNFEIGNDKLEIKRTAYFTNTITNSVSCHGQTAR